jgi:hypothetical protein
VLDADVATPDDMGAHLLQRRDHPGGLRVVDDDDVALLHALLQGGEVLGQGALVHGARGVVERAAVAGRAVQSVVDALGHREELGRPLDDDPAGVDADAAGIGEQRRQQLDHPAAASGRVDVPDGAALEELAHPHGGALELVEALGREHRAEPGRTHRRDLDLLHAHAGRPARAELNPRRGDLSAGARDRFER